MAACFEIPAYCGRLSPSGCYVPVASHVAYIHIIGVINWIQVWAVNFDSITGSVL